MIHLRHHLHHLNPNGDRNAQPLDLPDLMNPLIDIFFAPLNFVAARELFILADTVAYNDSITTASFKPARQQPACTSGQNWHQGLRSSWRLAALRPDPCKRAGREGSSRDLTDTNDGGTHVHPVPECFLHYRARTAM